MLVAVEIPFLALIVFSPFTKPVTTPSSVLAVALLNDEVTSTPFSDTETLPVLVASAGNATSIKALPPLTMCGCEDLMAKVGGEMVSLLPHPVSVATEMKVPKTIK